jgi:hypothetical protein
MEQVKDESVFVELKDSFQLLLGEYRMFNSPLSICSSSNCKEPYASSLEILPCSIPIYVTFAFPELMNLEARKIIQCTARSIGTCTSKVRMDLESIMLYLNKEVF